MSLWPKSEECWRDAVTYLLRPLLSTQTGCNGRTRARILDTLRCLWLWLTTFRESSILLGAVRDDVHTTLTPTDRVFDLLQSIVTSRTVEVSGYRSSRLCWSSRNFITGHRHLAYWCSKVAFKFFFWTWLFYLAEFVWHLPVPRRNSPTFEQLGWGWNVRAHLQFLDAEKLRSVQFSLTTLVLNILTESEQKKHLT